MRRNSKDLESELTKDVLTAAYAECGTVSATGRKLNINKGTLRRYMKKNDVTYKHDMRYKCDDLFFSRDNEDSFYWAGFIAADGFICGSNPKNGERHKTLGIGLSNVDIDHLMKFRQVINAESPIHTYKVNIKNDNPKYVFKIRDRYKSTLTIRSTQIYDDLARFGITERKSLTLKFPEWIMNHQLCNHFIRGYFDGDGCATSYKYKTCKAPQVSLIFCGTESFLTTVHEIFKNNMDLRDRETPVKPTESKCFKLKYGGNGLMSRMVPYIYRNATIFLDRKHKKATEYLDYEQQRELKYILTKEALVESYDRLQSIGLTAKELGVTDKDIKTYFKIHNIPIVDSYQEINSKKLKAACPKDLMEAAYLLYNGNITAVGRHFSIGKTTARRYLKQHGIIDDNSLPFPTR